MGGLRADFLLTRRIHPYADFLFGRGETHYRPGSGNCFDNFGPGYCFDGSEYVLTTNYVLFARRRPGLRSQQELRNQSGRPVPEVELRDDADAIRDTLLEGWDGRPDLSL